MPVWFSKKKRARRQRLSVRFGAMVAEFRPEATRNGRLPYESLVRRPRGSFEVSTFSTAYLRTDEIAPPYLLDGVMMIAHAAIS